MRCDVAVDDFERLAVRPSRFMGCVEPSEDTDDDRDEDGHGRGVPARSGESKQLGQRHSVQIVHDEKQLAVLRNHVERRHDVRVADARREPRFVDEHRDELRLFGEVRVHAFDGDDSLEPRRPEEAAEPHRRHAAGGDFVEDCVTPELAPAERGGRRHHGL